MIPKSRYDGWVCSNDTDALRLFLLQRGIRTHHVLSSNLIQYISDNVHLCEYNGYIDAHNDRADKHSCEVCYMKSQ